MNSFASILVVVSFLFSSTGLLLVEGWVTPLPPPTATTVAISSSKISDQQTSTMRHPRSTRTGTILKVKGWMSPPQNEVDESSSRQPTDDDEVLSFSSSKSSSSQRRRDILGQSWTTFVVGMMFLSPLPSRAVTASSSARVAIWPSIEYLEPVYELKLSVQALSQAAADTSKYELIQKRLEKFFKGGLFSERNYYAGLGATYMEKIQYDKNELNEYVRLDKEERFKAMEDTLQSLQDLLQSIQNSNNNTNDPTLVQQYANNAKISLDRWFALIPPEDVTRAGSLFLNTRMADMNRNGKLEPEELGTLSEDDRNLWKKRVAYVGD